MLLQSDFQYYFKRTLRICGPQWSAASFGIKSERTDGR